MVTSPNIEDLPITWEIVPILLEKWPPILQWPNPKLLGKRERNMCWYKPHVLSVDPMHKIINA